MPKAKVTVDAVWAQWEQIKKAEKQGIRHERPSALDGIPKHLPALLRAEKLVKKARKAGLVEAKPKAGRSRAAVGRELFALAQYAQSARLVGGGFVACGRFKRTNGCISETREMK